MIQKPWLAVLFYLLDLYALVVVSFGHPSSTMTHVHNDTESLSDLEKQRLKTIEENKAFFKTLFPEGGILKMLNPNQQPVKVDCFIQSDIPR